MTVRNGLVRSVVYVFPVDSRQRVSLRYIYLQVASFKHVFSNEKPQPRDTGGSCEPHCS